jgi:GMP synthase-like glutamine amidotransferase
LFGSLNGILFPGGGADILPGSQMFKTGQQLYKLSLQAADAGVTVPVMGHCMGFELLAYITSEDANILTNFDAEDIAMPLNFTSLASSSRMFTGAPSNVIMALKNKATTMNNHMWGVAPAHFKGTSAR